ASTFNVGTGRTPPSISRTMPSSRSRNASMSLDRIENPAAIACPPCFCRRSSQRASASAMWTPAMLRHEPFPSSPSSAMTHAGPPELHARAVGERAYAGDRRAIQRRESGGHDRAVRRAKRHDVGDRRERAELEELVLLQGVGEIAEQRLGQAQRDAGAGELLVLRGIPG